MEQPAYTIRMADDLGRLMKEYSGRDGTDGQEPEYIPYTALQAFWPASKITQVLNGYQKSPIQSPETIIKHFLRVFSLLVFLNHVPYLEIFMKDNLRDDKFPMEDLTLSSIVAPSGRRLLNDIKKWQWAFFPVIFDPDELYGQNLGPRCILPISQETEIVSGNLVTVTKIESSSNKNLLVRKTYKHTDQALDQYQRERSAFRSLRSHPSKHIVAHYGSYTQTRTDGTKTHNLILEYADGGNLKDFYKSTHTPRTLEEVAKFWSAFIGLFDGLYHLHICRKEPQDQAYQGIHQDIKPQNILVAKNSTNDVFEIILKITDFGHSHTVQMEGSNAYPLGVDSHGCITYGAPECSHHARFSQLGRSHITTEADIFSMGCIMSEAASWLHNGTAGCKKYEELRRAETLNIKAFDGSGHDGCFHNGVEPLEAVGRMHRSITNSIDAFDTITPQVLALVDEKMLVRKESRLSAKELHDKMSKIIQDANMPWSPIRPLSNQFELQHQGTTHTLEGRTGEPPQADPLSYHNQPGPSSPQNGNVIDGPSLNGTTIGSSTVTQSLFRNLPETVPMLSFEQAKAYHRDMKNKQTIDPGVARVISTLKNNLKDRDHMFFIDASASMYAHYDDVYAAFQTFAYIAKLIDTNGVELYTSSDPTKSYKNNTTTPLLKRLRAQTWDQIAFEDKFSKFVDRVVIPRLHSRKGQFLSIFVRKPLNILVFTDGKWGKGSDKAAGVENPIMRIIQALNSRGIGRTQIAIQFIRFGHDDEGMRYLSHLDELGKGVGCDFVDTKPINGNVYEIFVGALEPDIDDLD